MDEGDWSKRSRGFEESESDVPHSPTVWAITDLVFLLLIVFVLGVRTTPAVEMPVEVDSSRQKGPMTPFYGKQILVELRVGTSVSGDESFQITLRSHPNLEDRDVSSSLILESEETLFVEIEDLEQRLLELEQKHPDYFVRRTVVAPASLEYGRVLGLLGRLQDETGSRWLGAAVESDHG